MSSDDYLVVDHDGDVFQVYDGSMSCKLEDENYKPALMDTVATAKEVDVIIADYGYTEYGVEWTDAATAAAHDVGGRAIEKALDKISELNIKVVNLANKLEEHLKTPDAHNPAFMYKDKK